MQLTFRCLEDVEGDTGNYMPKLCWYAQEAEGTLELDGSWWGHLRDPFSPLFVELNIARDEDSCVWLHTEQQGYLIAHSFPDLM